MSQHATDNKPLNFDDEVEKKIIEKGLTHPRVTKESIDLLKDKLVFSFGRVSPTRIMCSAILDGFIVADGFAACVDPRNFDEEIGKQIAYKNCIESAVKELWKLEGYRLSRSLNETK